MNLFQKLFFLVIACAGSLAGKAEEPASKKEREISFRNHVQPVLAKTGCNAGACHGAAAGQNGFRLSLRGYDNEGDFISLTRHAMGRRISSSDPGSSLLLLKATGAVPHKGGKRFEVDSEEYRILAEWIAAGTPGPKPTDAQITRIEVSPPQVKLKADGEQQFKVQAHFSDGHSEDVTRWVKYTAANAKVTQVDDLGKVKVNGFGEGAITAWYLSRIAIANVSVPYTNEVGRDVFAKAPRRNFVDELVLEKLQSLNLPPSPRSSDSEFLRRAYLDSIGVVPTAEETRRFLADTATDKRDKLIETILARPEFIDYWSYKWSDLLLVSSKKLRPTAMWSYYNFIRDNVAANTPWDKFVRKIVTAQGSTVQNGGANFFVLHDNPADLSENTSQAFMGMSINCAKCHNHPMEKWTNDQYYQMANLFARVRSKGGSSDGENLIFVSATGDLVQPLRGKPQTPAPLDGKALDIHDPADRREALADWLASPENPYFTRAIVNRVWANFMGVGLVENVDDLRVTNPASNEKLFAAIADYLVQQKYDLKALMRLILQSETYQPSTQPLPENKDEERFYSRYYPKRLMAEVLLDSFSLVTGAPTDFSGYPKGWRAMQLPDSKVGSYFLQSFGRPEREQTCTCERTENPSVTQVLHIFNGDTLNKKIAAKDNAISKLLAKELSPEHLVEEAYLSTLARFPTDKEKQKMTAALKATEKGEMKSAVEDLYWALLSSKEFLFNH